MVAFQNAKTCAQDQKTNRPERFRVQVTSAARPPGLKRRPAPGHTSPLLALPPVSLPERPVRGSDS